MVNTKKTYRIYREEKLQVRLRGDGSICLRESWCAYHGSREPDRTNAGRWISCPINWLTGRRFRILNIVDDYTRECVGQIVDLSNSRANA